MVVWESIFNWQTAGLRTLTWTGGLSKVRRGMRRLRQLFHDNGRASVAANAGWLYLDQGLRAVIALLAFSAVTRYLGPEQYGLLAYAAVFPALFLPLATVGLDYVVVQELVRRPDQQNRIMATASLLLGAAALLSLLLALGCIRLLPTSHPAQPLVWITVLCLLGQPFQLIDFYFQSRVAARSAVLARLGASIVVNAFRLWLVWRGAPLFWFAWTFVLEALVTGFGLVTAYVVSGGRRIRPWADWDRGEAISLCRASWPLLLGGVAMAGYLRLDQLLLDRLAGSGALGRYAAAVRLGDATQFVTLAFINSYFPRFVAAHGAGPEVFAAAREQFFRRITWLAVTVAVGVTLAAPWITGGLLGPRFEGTAGLLVAFAWANVFAAQIGVRGKWFLVEGWQLHSLGYFVAGAVMHLAGVWLLAPHFGPQGAAISFCAAQAMMALVAPLVTAKTRLAARLAWRSFLPVPSRS